MLKEEAREVHQNRVTPVPGWRPKFWAGDAVRAVGGGCSYGRGEISEVTERVFYYRVDYGLGFSSLIR